MLASYFRRYRHAEARGRRFCSHSFHHEQAELDAERFGFKQAEQE
jgi:hypothetical protein